MDQPNNQIETQDEQIERIARELEARRGTPLTVKPADETTEPDTEVETAEPEAQAEPSQAAPAPTQAPAPKAAATPAPAAPGATTALPAQAPEPFPGYSALPPEAKAHYDRIAAEHNKLKQDYGAMYNRVAPAQRELDRLKTELAQARSGRPPGPKQIQRPSIEEWIKTKSPEMQQHFADYPQDARAAFDLANDVLDERLKELNAEVDARVTEAERRIEVAQLSAAHPDWARYRNERDPKTGQWYHPNQDAERYWKWVASQGDDVKRMATSNRAADISEALSAFKWEESNPEYRQTLELDEFQRWAAVMPPEVTGLVTSTDLSKRQLVLSLFWRDYEAATQPNGGGAADAEAQKAREIAARRARQETRTAPSLRTTSAPAATPAAAGSEDAAIEGIYQQLQARKNRR